MIEFDPSVNYGEHPQICKGFEVQLKSYDEGAKKYCVLKIETDYGQAEFILLPEEIHSLSEACRTTIEGVELRKDFFPKVVNRIEHKEMFPDI